MSSVYGNALKIEDTQLASNEINVMVEIFESIELNLLTYEQVREAFEAKVSSLGEGKISRMKEFLGYLAAFIMANGIHENLRDDLRITDGVTWKEVKAYWDFKTSEKQMFVRWCVPIMHALNERRPNSEKNLIRRQAEKWTLIDEYEAIPAKYRYFGSYFHHEVTGEQRSKILDFQKRVISLSGGGSTVPSATRRR
jgi:hypothetical protein